ncbi:MAG: hypothetical protein H7319_07700 [Spirosoma sp.]|nr:hypothetical protein [Spirosoma sp.]
MLKRLATLLLCWLSTPLFAQPIQAGPVSDTKAARIQLEKARADVKIQLRKQPVGHAKLVGQLLKLGLWSEATNALTTDTRLSRAEKALLWTEYHWLNNDFTRAEQDVANALTADATSVPARRWQAVLAIEAWKLPKAEAQCRALLARNPADDETSLVLGRALLLQKKYSDALAVAKQLQQRNPKLAGAYLLEANVSFWNQQPERAEAPLIKSLQLDPFNADARFSYGYAIWRRVDATQLNDMAAQWQLALTINPLHFQTHWHWGNGHTNLTFADYVDTDETIIRNKLNRADTLFRANRLADALTVTRRVEQQYPASVLPGVHRASLYYGDFDAPNRKANLDSAEYLFRRVLARKTHYGPAHNGLSAVIKSKRIPYLATYDSITTALQTTKINDPDHFADVFPDVSYYPGDRAKAMVWNQLFTSVVYFPFLAKQGNTFVIPPLHIDLAIAMKSPYFRSATTFDNRQWMDIRGVGSGAAAIEYVERGAYQERNVVLHEYVHLFHGRVLTDAENRQIRERYYYAMKNNLTLDYYSQNNESEYLAQTYPAYFEPMKVHPLDFKSMNITAELRSKDPLMYAFLDKLIQKERAYLAGNQAVMASNWAQVYLNLSDKAARTDTAKASRYLDSALVYDARYQPAYLVRARLQQRQKAFDSALASIKAAERIDPAYAPVYAAYAHWEADKAGPEPSPESLTTQAGWFQKALDLETDFQTRAAVAVDLRELYARNGQMGKAIKTAEAYAATAPDVSTYLRDRRDDARAFALAQRTMLGYVRSLDTLKKLVGQRPQNYDLRGLYADALLSAGSYRDAITTMSEVQRILTSGNDPRVEFDLRMAEGYAGLAQPDSANALLRSVLPRQTKLSPLNSQRLVRLLATLGRRAEADRLLAGLPSTGTPAYLSSMMQSRGGLDQLGDRPEAAMAAFRKSLEYNPYNLHGYRALAGLYRQTNRQADLAALRAMMNALDIRPGETVGL